MESGHKLMDTSDDVEDAENSGRWLHTKIQLVIEAFLRLVKLILHVIEKGVNENFHDSEKRQDISNVSRDLLCSNNFDALSNY